MLPAIREVLEFWFLTPDHIDYGAARPEWFRKDDAFDRQIGRRFGALIGQALDGGLAEWDQAGPQGTLARILVLDQLTRNVYRGTPQAFAGDTLALAAAQALTAHDGDLALAPRQRAFAYMPFEHAESAAEQARSLALFTRLAAAASGFGPMLDYAKRHHAVIERFGRFPHRNQILGRSSTPQELEFLTHPGSSF
ncbi:DUF924 family protein [Janthinobacterium agaricidamnosum]|uniref:Transmembrane protein n=1 Tax=Janthinobacterium agaricidamnosum NBRC 102515 = DSM 9628 TaxID=1349767 RepID=W0VEH3_9BURK|nr:DUF924 family protein [Janthinobacterium agaricidamnosum]CDG85813.1 conserved hypothetical protein [Janthinobacterium agaricidamnosum NBRC 102515 = DSM 9628]